MAFKHQESRNSLLHICYQAARAAAAAHNPYADPQEIALVGETIAGKIEEWMTKTNRDTVMTFKALDADNYEYFCTLLDEIHKTLPITQFFNVVLHVERLTQEQPQHAPTAINSGGQGGSQDLDL